MTQQIDFNSLNITINSSIKLYNEETQKEIFDYLKEMNDHEKKAYEIAINHLGSSFNIYRSNGFISWKKNKNFVK
jgi:hypothetical protein